jgi:predicted small lipoprotein YifL
MKLRVIILSVILLASLSACGLKRNLSLPDSGKRSSTQEQAAPAPVPTTDPSVIPQ